MDINSNLITAKNLLGDSGTWIVLVRVQYDTSSYVYYAKDQNEDITWNGQTWTWFPISFSGGGEAVGVVPTLKMSVSNIGRVVQGYVENYDLAGKEVVIYVVHSDYLAQTTNIPTFNWVIRGIRCDAKLVTFNLGVTPIQSRRVDPQEKMYKNFCRYGFPNSNDSRCPYTGGTTSCDRTLETCQTLNGSDALYYGGFPAIGRNKLYVK